MSGADNAAKKPGVWAKAQAVVAFHLLLVHDDTNNATPLVTGDGMRLDHVARGCGEPLILVHGSASDRRTWDAHIEPLSDRFQVVAYSRRYHWPNEPIAEDADYSMRQHVEDLETVIGAVGDGKAHLVGHSYGAFVCLLAAMRRPERVRSLVLAEPPVLTLFASDPPRPAEILRTLVTRPRTGLAIVKLGAFGIAPAAAALKRGDLERALRVLGAAILGRETFEGLSGARLEQARDNLIAAELLGSGLPTLDPGRVEKVRAPVLLVTGERSPPVFHRLTDRLEELLPSPKRVEIAGVSHIMHEDDPIAYRAALEVFLTRAESAARTPSRPG